MLSTNFREAGSALNSKFPTTSRQEGVNSMLQNRNYAPSSERFWGKGSL